MSDNTVAAKIRKPSRASGLGPYIFSLLVIIIPATTAYYFNLQSQTGYHQKRAFRALDEAGRLLDRNVAAFARLRPKTENIAPVEETLKVWMDEKSSAIKNNPIFSDINFTLLPAENAPSCSFGEADKFGFKRDQGHIKLVKEFCVETSAESETDKVPRLIKSTVSLDPVLADLRRRREFDVIALVRPDGDVLYSAETARSGFSSGRLGGQAVSRTKHYRNFKHLLQLANCKLKKNGDKSKADKPCGSEITLGQAAFIEMKVGDTKKLVFFQPYTPRQEKLFCDFTTNDCNAANKGSEEAGYIVGVVDASRFSERVQRIPPNVVAGIALFVLIALLLAPYLRIALGGPLASVSRLFTGYLLSAGVLSTGITIILILWATLGRSILETSEHTADKVAANIEEDVRGELIGMLEIYDCLRDKAVKMSTKTGDREDCPVPAPGFPLSERPPYRVMFFVDKDGKSIDKDAKYIFDYRDTPLKNVDVSGRHYFMQANVNGLALNKFQNNSEGVGDLPAFAIQRIMSYSTGSLSTAIAVPAKGFARDGPLGKAKVGVISGPLQSLAAPVLPSGFHFAIIEDDSGLVIAHDNAGRVLVEDFYREADDNPQLRALVKRRQSHLFHGKYHGRQSLFYTRAIAGVPWSIVVIQDKTLVQMARFEIAAIALGEFLLISMAIGICIFATIIFWRRDPWTWLWPMRRNIFDCHSSIFWVANIALSVVLIVGVIVILSFSGFWLIFWISVVMLSGAHLMYLVSAQPFDVKSLQHRRWRTPAVIVLALLLVAGMLVHIKYAEMSFASAASIALYCVISATLLVVLIGSVPKLLQEIWEKPKPGLSCDEDNTLENEQSDNTTSKLIVPESLRRFRHVSAGVLCLLMFGGLPAGAAFKDSYVRYMDLLFRHSAIDAAAGLDQRVGDLRSYIGSLRQKKSEGSGFSWTKGSNFSGDEKDLGVFLNGSLLTARSDDAPSSRLNYSSGKTLSKCSADSRGNSIPGLASFIVSHVFPVDERMARLHLAQVTCSDDRRWYWHENVDGPGVALNYLTRNGVPGGGDNANNWVFFELDSSVFHQQSIYYIAVFVLVMFLYIGVLYFQVSITGARLGGTKIPFILHRSGKRRPNYGKVNFDDLSFKHRLVLRASDRHIYTKESQSPSGQCEILKLDTASEPEFLRLQKILNGDPCVEVKVLHLSVLIHDLEQRQIILPLLESLVKENSDTKITLYADFNPLYRLTRPDAYRDNTSVDGAIVRDNESLRWSGLLSRFAKEYAWTPRDNLDWLDWKNKDREGDLTCAREMRIFHEESKVEALLKQKFLHARKEGLFSDDDDIPAEDIIALAGELGGAYYRQLWEECTHNERVLLHALAAGRCVNTLNVEIISHLMRRGLLVMEPSLSLVNDSFAEFIREAETPETYQHWQNDEQEKGAWQALRVPFLFLLFVPVAVLLVVATEELNGGIALMAPILTVIPMLMKGFGLRAQASG
ncbi:MAG: cache domain-containing protein [Gammaproteobacteria bacterium]|nr:cache domain-containing protein [Gammaproteobacteria bacterium]MBQ0839380.1 cache domain-containing protein [Gammaproteobacteria bacterium]